MNKMLGFDLDGTLVEKNTMNIQPNKVVHALRVLNTRGIHMFVITGKPFSYAQQVVKQSELAAVGIIAENASVYGFSDDSAPQVFGGGIESLQNLKHYMSLEHIDNDLVKIKLQGKEYSLILDPGDISILTFFTDPSSVSHRWNFQQTITAAMLYQLLQNIITTKQLHNHVEVLKPFSDGAVQILRKDHKGQVIDKSRSLDVIKKMTTVEHIQLAMFGDGHNDLPVMQLPGVIPITFSNADPEVINYVQQDKDGFISQSRAPDGDGVLDGLDYLARNHQFLTSDL